MNGGRRRRVWLALLIAPLSGIVLAFVAFSVLARSSRGVTPAQVGLKYARTEMVWTQGPAIVHERTSTMGALPALLPTLANLTLRNDVNTTDLLRRYRPDRKVDLLVLAGTYNSLPPDEGVNVQGEALVLVDARTDRVLFLTT